MNPMTRPVAHISYREAGSNPLRFIAIAEDDWIALLFAAEEASASDD